MRGDSIQVMRSGPPDEGGSIPTSPLQIRKRDWRVCDADMEVGLRLIQEEHYARGASNTAVYLHGLYPRDWLWHEECAGVAWWIPPTRGAGEALVGDRWEGVLALSRLAVRPEVPANACSFLLAHSVRMIDRDRWHTLVTYADSWRGHTGAIYRAAGWEYRGETAAEGVYTVGGRMTARKAGNKTRTHSEMLALGAQFHGRHAKSRFVLEAQPQRGAR